MASANVIEVTESNFASEVLQSAQPVLVDFWAPWCGPCRQIAPLIDELANQYAGRLKVAKVNVDNAGQLAAQFGINAIPSIFIFKNGQIHSKSVGIGSRADLISRIESALA